VKELAGQPAAPAGGTGDPRWFHNRILWKRLLDRDVVDSGFPGRVSPFAVSPTLLQLWMSILDGESQVERDLGCMRAFFKSGRGRCNEDLLDDLLILKLCGPQTGEDAGGTFAVLCVELWR
jgi:hypothetical protein